MLRYVKRPLQALLIGSHTRLAIESVAGNNVTFGIADLRHGRAVASSQRELVARRGESLSVPPVQVSVARVKGDLVELHIEHPADCIVAEENDPDAQPERTGSSVRPNVTVNRRR